MEKKYSGIYEIINIENNHRYIGSSCDLNRRLREHRKMLDIGKHHSSYLQNAWDKYGEDSFEFRILQYARKDDLPLKEQYWFCLFKPEYNMTYETGQPLLEEWTDEKKEKQSKARMGKNNPYYGKKQSDEAKARISKANKGSKRSEEAKQKMSKSGKGKHYHEYYPTEETKEKTRNALKESWKIGRIKRIGEHRSEEAKKRMSDAQKKRWDEYSEEEREKIREARKGKPLSKETREKISQIMRGSGNPFYGKSHSEETRKKISQANKGRHLSEETKKKMSKANKGKHLSEETRKKLAKPEKENIFGRKRKRFPLDKN